MPIRDSIDRLSDLLAGEDRPKGQTVSEAIDILTESIENSQGGDGGEGGGSSEKVTLSVSLNLAMDGGDVSLNNMAASCSEASWEELWSKVSSGTEVDAKVEITAMPGGEPQRVLLCDCFGLIVSGDAQAYFMLSVFVPSFLFSGNESLAFDTVSVAYDSSSSTSLVGIINLAVSSTPILTHELSFAE